jgi:hypothetical protein
MNPEKIQEAYAKRREAEQAKKREAESQAKYDKTLLASDLLQKAVIKSASAQIEAMASHEPKVEVKNLNEAVDAINKLNLTNFNASQPRIADMVENLEKLCKEMDQLSSKFKKIGFAPVSNALTQLLKQIEQLPKKISDITVKLERDRKVEDLLVKLNDSIKKIDFNPTINVEPPKVTVPKIDTSKLEKLIASLKEEESNDIDLDDYRAVIIDNESDDTMQYIGFLSTDGRWYIIYNDLSENYFLYKFGNTNFEDAWSRRMELDYKPLDVAVKEVLGETKA